MNALKWKRHTKNEWIKGKRENKTRKKVFQMELNGSGSRVSNELFLVVGNWFAFNWETGKQFSTSEQFDWIFLEIV